MIDYQKAPGVLENRKFWGWWGYIEHFQEEIELSFEEAFLLTFLTWSKHTYEVDRWKRMGRGTQARVMAWAKKSRIRQVQGMFLDLWANKPEYNI